MAHAVVGGRLASEVAHFDQVYAAQSHNPLALSEADRVRYLYPPADTIYPREYFYHLLGNTRGKKSLEIACGNGVDATLNALRGSNHYAYDLSPQAVDLTWRRAVANNVSDRLTVAVSGDFDTVFEGQTFDRIIGYACLHHLPLAGFGERIFRRLRAGGVAVFAEPVINSKALDAVRRRIPYKPVDVTEDEKPLCDADIAALARPFGRVVRREFQCISRVYPLLGDRPRVVAGLHRLDAWLMKLPPLRRFASVVVWAMYK